MASHSRALDASVRTVFRHARERSVMVRTHLRTRTRLGVSSRTLAAVGLTLYAGQRAALLVLHQVRARQTRRAHLYPSMRVTGMDGEATDIL